VVGESRPSRVIRRPNLVAAQPAIAGTLRDRVALLVLEHQVRKTEQRPAERAAGDAAGDVVVVAAAEAPVAAVEQEVEGTISCAGIVKLRGGALAASTGGAAARPSTSISAAMPAAESAASVMAKTNPKTTRWQCGSPAQRRDRSTPRLSAHRLSACRMRRSS
jgi:hypothetical protein